MNLHQTTLKKCWRCGQESTCTYQSQPTCSTCWNNLHEERKESRRKSKERVYCDNCGCFASTSYQGRTLCLSCVSLLKHLAEHGGEKYV